MPPGQGSKVPQAAWCSRKERKEKFKLNNVDGLAAYLCPAFIATLWAVACQGPLSMAFPRQEYWSRLPFPSPGDLPNPGIESTTLESPTLAGGLFYH